MVTVTIRESFDAYIEAEVEVTDEEYAALVKAREEGDTEYIEEWNAHVQSVGPDLDWQHSGLDCEGESRLDRIYADDVTLWDVSL